jgi:hypothetical protein
MQQDCRGKTGIEKTTETEPENVKKGLGLFYSGFILCMRQRWHVLVDIDVDGSSPLVTN